MEKRTDTIIQFSGLKPGIYHYDFELDGTFFSAFENEKLRDGKVHFSVRMEKKERLMLFHFSFSGMMKTPCDRCLAELEWPLQGEDDLCVKISATERSDSDDVIILPENAFQIDLAQWMYEFVAVTIPIRCVHPDDEQGNPTCDPAMMQYISQQSEGNNGSDPGEQDIDPRWAALKELKVKQ